MIIKIKIDEDSSLSFDTTDLPKDSDFDSLFEIIKDSSLSSSSQFKIAYAYKSEYKYCKQILDYIKSSPIRDIKTKATIFQMSLDMIHNNDIYEESDISYNSYYILLGFRNIKDKEYSRALVYFNKCQYKLGIELCNYYMKKECQYTNEILRSMSIFNNKDMSNYKIGKEMFKRNVSIDFYNMIFHENLDKSNLDLNKSSLDLSNVDLNNLNKSSLNNLNKSKSNLINIDVLLSILRRNINEISKLSNFDLQNDTFYYLKGKKYHLEGDYSKALHFYKLSLSLNDNILSKYNLQRILQSDVINEEYDCLEFNNFKYFMIYQKYKNEDIKCEVNNINPDIKRFINIMRGIKNNPESCISKYKTLLDNKLVDKNIIQNNIIYFKYKDKYNYKSSNIDLTNLDIDHFKSNISKDISNLDLSTMIKQDDINLLKDIYNTNSSVYVKYNIFWLTGDLNYYDKSNKFSTQIYNFLNHGTLEYLKIYDTLVKASTIKEYSECLGSFYGANGVAICLTKSRKYKEALKIFYSLVVDYSDVYINIGNVYLINKEIDKGFIEYNKVYDKTEYKEYIREKIYKTYKEIKNIDLLIRIYSKISNHKRDGDKNYKDRSNEDRSNEEILDRSIEDIKMFIFKRLIDENRLEEAEKYKVEDKELRRYYEEKKEEEEKIKKENERAIEELKRYKQARGN